MLPEEIKVNFAFNPRLLLVSPVTVLLAVGVFFLPWGAETAPAWVQAIGSVGAIVAALLIANHQHAVAERQSKIAEHKRSYGHAVRLSFFALEVNQIMSSVVLRHSVPGVIELDARIADVLEVMLNRLNQNFDDDPDAIRAGYCYEFRMLLSGCMFTLRATEKLASEQRDREISRYRRLAQSLQEKCTVHASAIYKTS